MFAAEYLRRYGHVVETACDGLDGLEKIRQSTFDLVITDLEMPKLDGIGFIRRLRENHHPIKIVVHSSGLNTVNLRELAELSVDATLLKGSPAVALRDIVAQIGRLPPDPAK